MAATASYHLAMLSVDIGEGREGRIDVYEEDDPAALAQAFLDEHGLDPSFLDRLTDHIATHKEAGLARVQEALAAAEAGDLNAEEDGGDRSPVRSGPSGDDEDDEEAIRRFYGQSGSSLPAGAETFLAEARGSAGRAAGAHDQEELEDYGAGGREAQGEDNFDDDDLLAASGADHLAFMMSPQPQLQGKKQAQQRSVGKAAAGGSATRPRGVAALGRSPAAAHDAYASPGTRAGAASQHARVGSAPAALDASPRASAIAQRTTAAVASAARSPASPGDLRSSGAAPFAAAAAAAAAPLRASPAHAASSRHAHSQSLPLEAQHGLHRDFWHDAPAPAPASAASPAAVARAGAAVAHPAAGSSRSPASPGRPAAAAALHSSSPVRPAATAATPAHVLPSSARSSPAKTQPQQPFLAGSAARRHQSPAKQLPQSQSRQLRPSDDDLPPRHHHGDAEVDAAPWRSRDDSSSWMGLGLGSADPFGLGPFEPGRPSIAASVATQATVGAHSYGGRGQHAQAARGAAVGSTSGAAAAASTAAAAGSSGAFTHGNVSGSMADTRASTSMGNSSRRLAEDEDDAEAEWEALQMQARAAGAHNGRAVGGRLSAAASVTAAASAAAVGGGRFSVGGASAGGGSGGSVIMMPNPRGVGAGFNARPPVPPSTSASSAAAAAAVAAAQAAAAQAAALHRLVIPTTASAAKGAVGARAAEEKAAAAAAAAAAAGPHADPALFSRLYSEAEKREARLKQMAAEAAEAERSALRAEHRRIVAASRSYYAQHGSGSRVDGAADGADGAEAGNGDGSLSPGARAGARLYAHAKVAAQRREAEAAEVRARLAAAEEWTCAACGAANPGTASYCSAPAKVGRGAGGSVGMGGNGSGSSVAPDTAGVCGAHKPRDHRPMISAAAQRIVRPTDFDAYLQLQVDRYL